MQAKAFLFISLYATVTLFGNSLGSSGVPQYLLQYVGDENCTTGNHSVNVTEFEHDLIAPGDDEAVYFQVMGFWRITQYNELGHHANLYLDGIGDECQHMWIIYNYRWTATRLGDPFQIEKEIQLYGGSYFHGVPYKVKGSMPSIIPPVNVGSFFFSGNYSWGLFSGPNYTGDTVCFMPMIQGRDWGITTFPLFANDFPLRSLKEGCHP